MSWFIVIWFILFSAELFLLILEKRKVMIWSTEKHKTKENLNRILAENTGRSIEEIYRDTERDNYMSAQEALEYGLVDKVIAHR